MYFANLKEIQEAAVKAADREGVPFYIIYNPTRQEKKYTALTSISFGLPKGFLIEEKIEPCESRFEIEPPEKVSTNGF